MHFFEATDEKKRNDGKTHIPNYLPNRWCIVILSSEVRRETLVILGFVNRHVKVRVVTGSDLLNMYG